MTLAEAKMFLRNYDEFVKIFGEKILGECIEKYELYSFSTFEYVPLDYVGTIEIYQKAGYPVLCERTSYTFKEFKPGGWERDVKKLAKEFRVPDQNQISESKLLRDCLIMRFPYLSEFNMNLYHLDSQRDNEFYIPTVDTKSIGGRMSLYCPMSAFLKNDYSIIENRTRSYLEEYYKGEDRKRFLDKEIQCLDSLTARKLKVTLDYYKEKEERENAEKRRSNEV